MQSLISENTMKSIKRMKPTRVMIQAPEGLKTRIQDISKYLEGMGLETVISCDPCFGACDIADSLAISLGCDIILHIGHTDFGVKSRVPVIYEEFRLDADIEKPLKKNLNNINKYKSVGLVTSVQYVHLLDRMKIFLEKNNKKVLIPEQTKFEKRGQILGCRATQIKDIENDADCFLFLGSGLFHPLGLSLQTEKPVFRVDIDTGEFEDMQKRKQVLERVKAFNIMKAQDALNFGILVSSKPGQERAKVAVELKRKLEGIGKRVWILAMDMITPEKIMGMKLDVLVNTACPRMNEDGKLFGKPILNPEDVDSILQV